MGFVFLMPCKKCAFKLSGYSMLWLECGEGIQYDRELPTKQKKKWKRCWNPHFTASHPKSTATPTTLFKAVRSILHHMEGSALSLLLPGQKIPHASGGCPAQKLLLFYRDLFLVLLTSNYSPSEILVTDLNAPSLHQPQLMCILCSQSVKMIWFLQIFFSWILSNMLQPHLLCFILLIKKSAETQQRTFF